MRARHTWQARVPRRDHLLTLPNVIDHEYYLLTLPNVIDHEYSHSVIFSLENIFSLDVMSKAIAPPSTERQTQTIAQIIIKQ